MRTYGMTHPAAMSLPMPVFWHLSGSVPRLLADERRDLLEISVASQHSELSANLREHFAQMAPSPIKQSVAAQIQASAVRDQAGFNQLKAMVNVKK